MGTQPTGDDAQELISRIQAHVQAGQWAEVLPPLDQLLALRPQDANLWYNKGAAHARLGQTQAAEQALRRCLQVNPAHPKATAALQQLQAKAAAPAPPVATVPPRPAAPTAPPRRPSPPPSQPEEGPEKQAERLLVAANLEKSKRNFDAAIARAKAAMSLNPSDPWAPFFIGEVCFQQGRFEEAVEHLEKAAAVKPDFLKALEMLEEAKRRLPIARPAPSAAAPTALHVAPAQPAGGFVRAEVAPPSTGIVAGAVAAVGAAVAGYLISFVLFKIAVGSMLSQLASMGGDQIAKSLPFGLTSKLVGLTFLTGHHIGTSGQGRVNTMGLSGEGSGSAVMPLTMMALVPALCLFFASFAAAKWRPATSNAEVVQRGAATAVAYAVLLALMWKGFSINLADVMKQAMAATGSAGQASGEMSGTVTTGLLSTLIHAPVFGFLFGAAGAWVGSQAYGWWPGVVSGFKNEDRSIPHWLHAPVAAFVVAQIVLTLLAAPILMHKMSKDAPDNMRGSLRLSALNLAPAAAGMGYYLLIGVPLKGKFEGSTFGTAQSPSISISLLGGLKEEGSGSGGSKEKLPWYMYLGVLIPLAALIWGGTLASSQSPPGSSPAQTCLAFAGVHAALLLLLLFIYRVVVNFSMTSNAASGMGGMGGMGGSGSSSMSGAVTFGPDLAITAVVGLVVGLVASFIGSTLESRSSM